MSSYLLKIGYPNNGSYIGTMSGTTYAHTGQNATLTEAAATNLLFWDDFASGDLSKTMNGVTWGGLPEGSIISGFSIYGSTGFCARNTLNNPSNALLGFELGAGYQELWLLWKIYMPTGSESPYLGPKMEDGAVNGNKFLRVTAIAGMTSPYPRYGASMYPSTGTDVNLGPQAGIFPGTGTVSQLGDSDIPLVNDANRGRWLTIEWHGKNSTSAVSPNGEQDFWIDGSLVRHDTGIDSYESGNPGFEQGYLFGSTDGPWATDPGTYVYIGYFAVSDTARIGS